MSKAEAVAVLQRCIRPSGLQASGYSTGHNQVWARDTMIALLGARFARDPAINNALLASLALLKSRRSSTGAIPNNVDSTSLRANYRAYADAGLWWIIGSSILQRDRKTADEILRWYACQDVDQSGLISMQEAADWQDLFCTRGKGLYLNCLYVIALRAAGHHDHAASVASQMNATLWYRGDGDMLRHLASTFSTENVQLYDSLGRKRWLPEKKYLVDEQYYLPYVAFRAVGEWFDSLGNLLAILSGVADAQRSAIILDFIERHRLADAPIRAIAPAIQPGDSDWRDYYGTLNAPHRYHNGGVWPFIGGFYVAALVKCGRIERAEEAFARLTDLNGEGEFNEWHDGETLEPRGAKAQAWSAGMYLFAEKCLEQGSVPAEWLGIRD